MGKIFRKNKNNVPMPESNAHDLLHGLHDFFLLQYLGRETLFISDPVLKGGSNLKALFSPTNRGRGSGDKWKIPLFFL